MEFLLQRGNSDLSRSGTFVWSIPALTATLPSGRRIATCPNAGVCAGPCYARWGTYRFSNVVAAHVENLRLIVEEPEAWEREMTAELLVSRRYRGSWVRLHDAGDFFSEEYARAWCRIASAVTDVTFYAYTKEVSLWKRIGAARPGNLVIIYSLGGREDHLIDRDRDRHADVFPDLPSLEAAGYTDQAGDDRLAVVGPKRVGIIANNIPAARRRQAGRSFGDWQASRG